MRKTNVLVTGGAGFIGSHLADRLIKLGYKVTIFDNLSTGVKKYVNPKATFVNGDVVNEEKVKFLFRQRFEVVCHIAGCASVINSFTDVHRDARTNFIGTINIVTEALTHRVPRLLYASSMTTYGNIKKLPIQEDSPCYPISYYGISKYAAERFVHATAERTDLKHPFHATSFRMFNVYGPRQSLTNPYQGAMAIFIGNALRGEPINIFGDGKQARDFVYIDDVIDAWIDAVENKKSFDRIFNIGYGHMVSINKLVETILLSLGKDPKTYEIQYKPPRPGEQRFMKANINLAKKYIGFNPKITLREGLIRTIKWAKVSQHA